jgi:glycine betaine catabolism B
VEERTGKIVGIKNETYDVKTFRLILDREFSFISGQYCIVSIVGQLEGQTRPFTFSSSPTEKSYVELTIKKAGVFTSALHSMKKGGKLKISGPFGESLKFDESVNEDVVFIAGGSGITPFISALRYAAAKDLPNRLVLLFSNRSEKDIIRRKELESLNERAKIRVVHTLTNEVPDGWKGERGFISWEMALRHIENPMKKRWYICGPPPMTKAMKEMLSTNGIPEKMIMVESWEIAGKHDGK